MIEHVNYTSDELYERYGEAISAANRMAGEDSGKVPNAGSCSIGGGIAVYLGKSDRPHKPFVIVHNPHQGDSGAVACKRALDYLMSIGISCFWHWGEID